MRARGLFQSSLRPFRTEQRRLVSSLTDRTKNAPVVIIGGGVIGCSIALELARQHKVRTLVLDASPAPGGGSTCFSSGICRQFYSTLDNVKMAWEGYQSYVNWEQHLGVRDEAGMIQARIQGGLVLRSAASRGFVEKTIRHHEALGIPYSILSNQEMAEQFRIDSTSYYPPKRIDHPDFGVPTTEAPIEDGVYFPQTAYVSDPGLAAANLRTAGVKTGLCDYSFNTKVARIEKQAGRVTGVVTADGRRIACDVVVNAAGPHSSKITQLAFENAGVENDMRWTTKAMRVEVAYIKAPAGAPPLPVLCDMDTGMYLRSEVGDKIVIGGIEPECDPAEWVDPDNFDKDLTDNWTNFVYRAGLRISGLEIPSKTTGVVSLYDVTEDWVPIYDKSSLGGYYMAIGTSGNQFKMAPVSGRMMAQLIAETENGQLNHDVTPLVFRLPITQNTLDVGTFSRLRKVQATTATVMA